mmetsp:Transcript_41060/g.88995  ORF Transcript_41060/g.88995 Transcript_41060/m.88995 type:complete len:277 (+) Transcript_41060:479-1309(+)
MPSRRPSLSSKITCNCICKSSLLRITSCFSSNSCVSWSLSMSSSSENCRIFSSREAIFILSFSCSACTKSTSSLDEPCASATEACMRCTSICRVSRLVSASICSWLISCKVFCKEIFSFFWCSAELMTSSISALRFSTLGFLKVEAFSNSLCRESWTSACSLAFRSALATAAWVTCSSSSCCCAKLWVRLWASACSCTSRSSLRLRSCCSASKRSCMARNVGSSLVGDGPSPRAWSSRTALRHRDTASRNGLISSNRVLLALRCKERGRSSMGFSL